MWVTMLPPPKNGSLLLDVALVVTSGLLWCVSWVANMYVMEATHVAPGIDLVFLPAGFRLLIVIVFGVWGALGIALADPLMFVLEFHSGDLREVILSAVVSGFAPFLAVKAFFRVAGIERSLTQLKPIHLPLLALTVSVVTPFLFNVLFVIMGRQTAAAFLPNFTAMMTGDFLGCLIVSVLARAGLAAGRAAFHRPR